MFHKKILNKVQLEILENLKLPKQGKFYLAGETALALQLGHRTSIDFDFYSQEHFDNKILVESFSARFPTRKVIFQAEDTLKMELKGTGLSFFFYAYSLLRPTRKFYSLNLASVEDIAAMKVAAIVQRGTKRDFIDLFYLLQRYSLDKVLRLAIKKYPGYQEMLILRALIYFEDAEKEKYQRPLKIFDKNFSWERAKKKIFQEVKKYQLSMIKDT